MICLIPSRLGRRMEDGPQGKLSIINYQTSDRFEYKHFQCDKIYLLVAIIVALQMLILQFALYQ